MDLDFDQAQIIEWSNLTFSAEKFEMHPGKMGRMVDSELCYFLSFFELLTKCSSGKNSFSENISQNIVPLNRIQEVISSFTKANIHPIIKMTVLNFFYEVYLETERDNFFYFQQILV